MFYIFNSLICFRYIAEKSIATCWWYCWYIMDKLRMAGILITLHSAHNNWNWCWFNIANGRVCLHVCSILIRICGRNQLQVYNRIEISWFCMTQMNTLVEWWIKPEMQRYFIVQYTMAHITSENLFHIYALFCAYILATGSAVGLRPTQSTWVI